MTKTYNFDITDENIKDGLLTGLGAGVMFYVQRFFKNKDSLSIRVRNLENQHARIETKIENLDKYIHNSVHDLKNMINEKNLKDEIVDQVFQTVQEIKEKINETKKQ